MGQWSTYRRLRDLVQMQLGLLISPRWHFGCSLPHSYPAQQLLPSSISSRDLDVVVERSRLCMLSCGQGTGTYEGLHSSVNIRESVVLSSK